ncbi:MAG: hypothetical protein CME63_16500 [Halobacteriovoraceae bacterium]|nr:hypothetical protein [Halobacteriovoraceae bacterium]|tara:strand:+ start:9175 stop:10032 length:858 start_codon:yes stop_codon:yes gene_type:complete
MRFGAHQTFHIRDSWLYKGLHSVEALESDDTAMVELGIGKNMVGAMKFWMTALDIAENNEAWSLTSLGSTIKKHDPYFELDGTLLLLHYTLATNKTGATAWYWFFNKFSATEFDTESLLVYYEAFVANAIEKKIQESTLKKDINCVIRTYKQPKLGEKVTPETENPSPFSKFQILTEEGKKLRKNKLRADHLPSEIFIYLMHLYWRDFESCAPSMNLEALVEKECSPGLVLGLGLDEMIELIERSENEFKDKYFRFSRTGGYNIIEMNEENAMKALTNYYKANQL